MKPRKNLALILTAAALLALLPLAAFAERGERHRGHGPGRGMFPPPGYLDLTAEQAEAARAIHDGVRAEMEAGREQRRTLHQQLEAALDGGDPNAAAVGSLAIELHGLKEQARAMMEDAESRFAALLNAEQLEKWQHFKELRQERRGARHRGGFGAGFGDGPGRPDFVD